MVVNGSLSETAVNASAGARSQLSGLIVAALTVITLLALTGLFEDLTQATLSAIVIAAVIDLVDVPALIDLYRAYSRRLGREFGIVVRPDFIAAIAALLGLTVFDTLPGLFIGITVSLLLLVYRASRPYVSTLGKTPGPDGHYRDIDRHPEAHLSVNPNPGADPPAYDRNYTEQVSRRGLIGHPTFADRARRLVRRAIALAQPWTVSSAKKMPRMLRGFPRQAGPWSRPGRDARTTTKAVFVSGREPAQSAARFAGGSVASPFRGRRSGAGDRSWRVRP
jgi:hypothetical protein